MIAPTSLIIEHALHEFNWINRYDPTQWASFECYMLADKPRVTLTIGRLHDGWKEAAIETRVYGPGTLPYSVRYTSIIHS